MDGAYIEKKRFVDYRCSKFVKSCVDNDGHEMDKPSMIVLEPDKVIDPDDMVGRTFLMDPDDQGLRHRVRIVKAINDHDKDLGEQSQCQKFLLSINNDQ